MRTTTIDFVWILLLASTQQRPRCCDALVLVAPSSSSSSPLGRHHHGQIPRRSSDHRFVSSSRPPSSSSWASSFSFSHDGRRRRRQGGASSSSTDHHHHLLFMSRSSSTMSSSSRRRRLRRRRPRHYYYDGQEGGEEVDDDTVVVGDNCPVLFKDEVIDHQGLAKSIDVEYAIEEAKLDLSFWEVLKRERARDPATISDKSQGMTAWARARRRMTYARGDVESKYALMAPRAYGEAQLLDRDHLRDPPSLEDLNVKPPSYATRYWSTTPFRYGVVVVAYFAFPLFCSFWSQFETISPKEFDTVVRQLAPNVGVLYATILALTLQVLYNRFTRIQESVATEAMLLSQVTRNLLALFADEPDWALESCQMVANQVRMMLSRTRGVELLSIMKADTYANILAAVDDYHYLHGCDDDFTAQEESVLSMLRSEIAQLMETRALRLSDEARSLPPTHFTLVTSLSAVSIVAYVTASLSVVDDLAHPPQEARLLFAALVALYILFFNFCRDLNSPYQGVYQIKRSNAVSHLMQTKWLIVKELGDAVSFGVNYGEEEEEPKEQEEEKENSIVDNVSESFSGEEREIAEDGETVRMSVNDLETALETIDEEGDLCETVIPASTSSLDCTEDGREARLFELQDELARLKRLNQQLENATEASVDRPDPEARLRRMEQELARLRRLNQQIAQTTGQVQHEGSANPVALSSGARQNIGVTTAPPLEHHIPAGVSTEEGMARSQNGDVQRTTLAKESPSELDLLEQAEEAFKNEQIRVSESEERRRTEEAAMQTVEESRQKAAAIEAKMMPLSVKATGVSFEPKLDDGLYLIGVGVRKKAIINLYSVAMYSSISTLEAISSCPRGERKQETQAALQNAAREFGDSSPTTSFVLEMNFKVDAQTVAEAMADSVKPRYDGPAADLKELQTLISEGVKSIGGQATKGTVFRYDCTKEGVSVSVDGRLQGMASFKGMGRAFVDVFTDSKAVSPQLVESCLDTWCGSSLFSE